MPLLGAPGAGWQGQAEVAQDQQMMQMPEQARLQNQTMQSQLRQQQIQTQQMQRLNDPQTWKDTASTMDQVIAATTDPEIKARLGALKQQVMQGIVPPPQMIELMTKMDDYKVQLEQAKAYQAYMSGGLSGTTTNLINKAMPGTAVTPPAGGTPGMPPVRAGGGNTIRQMNWPDGKVHNVLVDPSGHFLNDLGPAGP